jgi:aryl-alcohol dehydrogenase-like predicted oxidoreductase
MEKVQLGNTGVQVRALCLGTDHYGSSTDAKKAHALLDQFYEAGGTFIDTANVYAFWEPGFTGGESETTIGRWLKERRNRQQVFIGTKVGGGADQDAMGLRAEQIEGECEKSLKRLGIETIDLYYSHLDDRNTPHEEVLKAFDRLVEAGKVRFIAASNHKAWRLAEARLISQVNGWASYCAIEQRHTYLRPKPDTNSGVLEDANEDLLDYCRNHGVSLLAYSILLRGGAYTRSDRSIPDRYLGPDSDARLSELKAVSSEIGATPNQVIIAWMRQSDPPIIPIIGGSKPEQLSENIGALNFKLSEAYMDRLNKAGA